MARTCSTVRSATSNNRYRSAWSASTLACRCAACSSARDSCASVPCHLANCSSNCAMRFCTKRRWPARPSRSSSVSVRLVVRSAAVARAPVSCPARSSSCCAMLAASARSSDARSRCSVADASDAWRSSSSWPSARVCSASPSRLSARFSSVPTDSSRSPMRRSARSTAPTTAGTSFSMRSASSACAFNARNRWSVASIRMPRERVRSSSCDPVALRSAS